MTLSICRSHLSPGLKDAFSGMDSASMLGRKRAGKSVEAGTVSVAGEPMCLGDRRGWATVGQRAGAGDSGCQAEGWSLIW